MTESVHQQAIYVERTTCPPPFSQFDSTCYTTCYSSTRPTLHSNVTAPGSRPTCYYCALFLFTKRGTENYCAFTDYVICTCRRCLRDLSQSPTSPARSPTGCREFYSRRRYGFVRSDANPKTSTTPIFISSATVST